MIEIYVLKIAYLYSCLCFVFFLNLKYFQNADRTNIVHKVKGFYVKKKWAGPLNKRARRPESLCCISKLYILRYWCCWKSYSSLSYQSTCNIVLFVYCVIWELIKTCIPAFIWPPPINIFQALTILRRRGWFFKTDWQSFLDLWKSVLVWYIIVVIFLFFL